MEIADVVVDVKQLRAAGKILNDSKLVEGPKLKTVGVTTANLIENFLKTVESIPENRIRNLKCYL